jgi:hypothetical protein
MSSITITNFVDVTDELDKPFRYAPYDNVLRDDDCGNEGHKHPGHCHFTCYTSPLRQSIHNGKTRRDIVVLNCSIGGTRAAVVVSSRYNSSSHSSSLSPLPHTRHRRQQPPPRYLYYGSIKQQAFVFVTYRRARIRRAEVVLAWPAVYENLGGEIRGYILRA